MYDTQVDKDKKQIKSAVGDRSVGSQLSNLTRGNLYRS
jgi:hypothetical protein